MLIKTLKGFDRQARKLMTGEALEALFDHLASHPDAGDIMQGTGGVRKLRWHTGRGGGKSGGVRVIYYYEYASLVLLLSVYAKSGKGNLTQAERNAIKKALPALVKQAKEE